jgi:hypothetical protein
MNKTSSKVITSVQQEKESAHEKFQGVFDRQC